MNPLIRSSAVAAILAALSFSVGAQQQPTQVRIVPTNPVQEGPQTGLAQGERPDDQGYTYQPCQLTQLFMTRSGVGFICDLQNQGSSDVLVTFTGDGDSTRLAAITDFLLLHHGATLVPVYSRAAVTPVCAEMAREYTAGKVCHELMQIGPVRRTSMRN